MVSFTEPVLVHGQFVGETVIDYSIDFMQGRVAEAGFYKGKAALCIISHPGVITAHSKRAEILGESLGVLEEDLANELSNIQRNSENAKQIEIITLNATEGVKQEIESANIAVKWMKGSASKITINNDIAFLTNVLALNTALAAAWAGEHGKGFAVGN